MYIFENYILLKKGSVNKQIDGNFNKNAFYIYFEN